MVYRQTWYIVKQGGANTYQQVWISDSTQYPPLYITRTTAADGDGDGIGEIYVGLSNGVVKVYSGKSFQEIGSFTASSTILAIVVADVDGDGQLEIVSSDGANIYVFSALSLTQKWVGIGYGGSSIAVGNVANDSGPEMMPDGLSCTAGSLPAAQ